MVLEHWHLSDDGELLSDALQELRFEMEGNIGPEDLKRIQIESNLCAIQALINLETAIYRHGGLSEQIKKERKEQEEKLAKEICDKHKSL